MARKVLSASVLLCWLVLVCVPPAFASDITRDVYVETENAILRQTTDNLGNVGLEFAFEVDVLPFSVMAGDQIVTRVTFDRPLLVRDAPQSDFFAFPGNLSNLELFFFSYGYADGGVSGSGSVSEANLSFVMSLDADGSTVATTRSGGVTSAGGGMSAAYFGDQNWTDATFLLRGIELTTTITAYSLERGSGVFDSFGGSIFASTVTPVPEPSTFLLSGIGLAFIAATRRRWGIRRN